MDIVVAIHRIAEFFVQLANEGADDLQFRLVYIAIASDLGIFPW